VGWGECIPFFTKIIGEMRICWDSRVARKIADILDVSLDYLTGKVDVEMDKTTKKRILEVSKFDETDRLHIFSVIDAFIAKRKIQSIM